MLAQTYRASAGRILASLVVQCGDLEQAEDALHSACLQAERHWPKHGLPNNPGAWLYTTAKRRMQDQWRAVKYSTSEATQRRAFDAMAGEASDEAQSVIPDERLSLIFTCCHPALNPQAQVALTLKVLCGLTVREIARAFLVSDTTMAQRLVRAKKKIRTNGIAYKVPEQNELGARLDTVLSVIYLVFNESYTAYEGQNLTRDDLANEAIRLARLVNTLLDAPESAGLLALLLLHQSRRAAREGGANELIPLEHQDRARWNRPLIKEGRALLIEAMARGDVGRYQIQAAISAIHADSESWAETDWPQIIGLYAELLKRQPDAVTQLNMWGAVAHSGDFETAQRGLKTIAKNLEEYQPYHATKAYIERRLGSSRLAVESYERAIALTNNQSEKAFLEKQKAFVLSS